MMYADMLKKLKRIFNFVINYFPVDIISDETNLPIVSSEKYIKFIKNKEDEREGLMCLQCFK